MDRLSVLHLPEELDLSTTDLLLEGEEDRDEDEDLEEEEEVLEVRVIGEEVVLVVVVDVVVVTVVLSFLRLRDFLPKEEVLVVEGEVVVTVVVGFGVVDVVVVGMVDSQGFEVLMRFHQGLREVAGSGVAVVVVLVSVTEDLSVVEVKLFHHFRLGDRGNEKNVLA